MATFPCKIRGKSTNTSDQLPETPQVMISLENRVRNVCSLSVGPRNKRKRQSSLIIASQWGVSKSASYIIILTPQTGPTSTLLHLQELLIFFATSQQVKCTFGVFFTPHLHHCLSSKKLLDQSFRVTGGWYAVATTVESQAICNKNLKSLKVGLWLGVFYIRSYTLKWIYVKMWFRTLAVAL